MEIGSERGRVIAWHRVWVIAGAVSLGLLGFVAIQLDPGSLGSLVGAISYPAVGAAVALFVAENLFSAVRTHIMAQGAGGFATAMRVTAWHGIWSIILPLRLGEVAWVIVMRRAYGWSLATAVACATVQRLLDLVAVTVLFLLTVPMAAPLGERWELASYILAGAACLLALAGLATLPVCLRLGGRLLAVMPGPARWRRVALLNVNRARHWLGTVRHRSLVGRCILPTVLVWAAVIAAYWAAGEAIGLDLTAAEAGFAATGSNLAAALPVQTIGGIGLLEAGFTGIVAWLGAPVASAAGAALLIRLCLIAGTGLFWLIAQAAGMTIGARRTRARV